MNMRIDNRLLDCPMVSVPCRRCDAHILVRKSSWNQTSVQWNTDATARCAERADAQKIATPGSRGVFIVCSALSAAILDAVRRGDLSVVDEKDGAPR